MKSLTPYWMESKQGVVILEWMEWMKRKYKGPTARLDWVGSPVR